MNNLYQNDLLKRFNQFKQMYKGNPQMQIQQMLNSGQITQAQLNDAQMKANQLMQLFK